MKFTLAAAVLCGLTQAIKLDNEYAIWHSLAPPPPIWDVVKRGEHGFQDLNVEMAMKANPSNAGEWPIKQYVEPDFSHALEKKPFWAKQDWEFVVKKGNNGYNDKQVDKAMLVKGEPIRVPSEGSADKAAATEAAVAKTIEADVAKGV